MIDRPPPRWTRCTATRAALVLLLALSPGWARAQDLVAHHVSSSFLELPDASAEWSRIGAAGALVTDDRTLLINDNSMGDCIAFQTMLGAITADHRVTVRAVMQVLENLGGASVMIEITRPGLELVVQFERSRLDVLERRGREGLRWLAGADVDLTSTFHAVEIRKAARDEDPLETLVVAVDGVELLRAAGRGDGELAVGRVLFGSLDYVSLGASVWDSIEVDAMPVVITGGVAVEDETLGALKARYRR